MYWRRLLEAPLKEAGESFAAVIVTGPRQSGKTTLLTQQLLTQEPTVLRLDDPFTRQRLGESPLETLRNLKKPCILDEIQYMPELTHFLRILIDEDRAPGQWYITGSHQFFLMRDVVETLAGRAAILSLPPLSLVERQDHPGLESWLLQSSYPELATSANRSQQLWYSSYIQTYLERDVRSLLDIGNLRDFEQCLRLLASRTGQILDMSDISKMIGISVPTVKRWISVLEASYILFLVPPYFNNFGKRIIKAPKLYFYDTGLVNELVGIRDASVLINGPMAGAIFETAIMSDIVKQQMGQGHPREVYYWRTQSGLEIDCLLPVNGSLVPIEIKLSRVIKGAHLQPLRQFQKMTGIEQGFIVSNSEDVEVMPAGIRSLHWSKLSLNMLNLGQ